MDNMTVTKETLVGELVKEKAALELLLFANDKNIKI